jgi:hypothetical protein
VRIVRGCLDPVEHGPGELITAAGPCPMNGVIAAANSCSTTGTQAIGT